MKSMSILLIILFHVSANSQTLLNKILVTVATTFSTTVTGAAIGSGLCAGASNLGFITSYASGLSDKIDYEDTYAAKKCFGPAVAYGAIGGGVAGALVGGAFGLKYAINRHFDSEKLNLRTPKQPQKEEIKTGKGISNTIFVELEES